VRELMQPGPRKGILGQAGTFRAVDDVSFSIKYAGNHWACRRSYRVCGKSTPDRVPHTGLKKVQGGQISWTGHKPFFIPDTNPTVSTSSSERNAGCISDAE